MILRHLIWFFLLISALSTYGQPLTREQLQADFARFRTALNEVHPAMYRYTPKATFDSLFTTTATRLNRPMTQQEFYVVMTPLLVALRDGHIKWIVAGHDEHYPFSTDKLFPLKLYFLNKQAWVVDQYGSVGVPAGAEVTAINGQPVAAIIGQLLPNMTFADGTTTTGKYQDLNQFFSGYYATFIGTPTVHQVTYKVSDSTRTIHLPAISYAAIEAHAKQHKSAAQKAYRVTFSEDERTAIMTIERFSTQENEQRFKTFLAEAFREIKTSGVQNLVLDVRNNEGGEEKYGLWLYEYLAQKPFRYYDHISVSQKKAYSFPAWTSTLYRMVKWLVVKKKDVGYVFTRQAGLKTRRPRYDAFAGRLYVLINGGSFSVTTEFAARVHADRRGIFIGQETGGAYEGNSSGLFTITQLPNAKIDLGIPMFGFHIADLPANLQTGQGIRPDHVVIPTIDDVLTGNDRVMKYTRQLIQSGGGSTPPKTTAVNK